MASLGIALGLSRASRVGELTPGDAGYIYVRESGNDTTGDGTLGAPFATFQHAINVFPEAIAFDFGAAETYFEASFDGVHTGDLTITIRGVEGSLVRVVYATSPGVTFDITMMGALTLGVTANGGGTGFSVGTVKLHGSAGQVVTFVIANGLNGVDRDSPEEAGQAGGDGGRVELYGPFTLEMVPNVAGGAGGSSPGGSGANGNPGSWEAFDGTITP